MVTTTAFEGLTRAVADRARLDARIAVVEHPLGGIPESEVLARADAAVEQVLALFTAP